MIPGNANPLLLATAAEAAAADVATKSLRFNGSDDSAYLNRTPSSAGNRKTWTWSAWVKRTKLGSEQAVFNAWSDNNNRVISRFNSSNQLQFLYQSGGTFYGLTTTQVFRDPGAWLHLVLVMNTSDATSTDRTQIYINGSRIADGDLSAFSTGKYPPQNTEYHVNSTIAHHIGARKESSAFTSTYLNGYLADVYFIDGSAISPVNNFIELDDNGVYQARAYSGTFGTNGFHLSFSDATSTTTIAEDSSGNNNDWTANNISVTAGSGNDSMFDAPANGTQSDTGAGGEVSGNYAVFNALALNSNTLSNGNLDSTSGSNNKVILSTFGIPNSGKWYFELTDVDSSNGAFIGGVGALGVDVSDFLGRDANGWGYQLASNGTYYNNNTASTTGQVNGHGSNTILGVAIDRGSNKIWFSVNNTFVNSGNPANGTNAQFSNLPSTGPLFPGASSGSGKKFILNAGQRAFAYTAPSGYKALCTTNLPTPTIADGSDYFEAKTYTGNSSTNSITGLNFSPDFVWIKNRVATDEHMVFDTIRGALKRLNPSTSNNELSQANTLTAFNSDGFTLGSDGQVNQSTETYISWNWDAGSSTASNTDGSITSSVRANASAGFSIVTYTGNGTNNATVGHGLGAAPAFITIKRRNSSGDWPVYHASYASPGVNDQAYLNHSFGATGNIADIKSPNSTTFALTTWAGVNGSSDNYVAYCFAPVEGYSAFGSYTGNGSTDGPFVALSFRPAVIILKRTDSASSWQIRDTARSPYNVVTENLYPNLNNAESTDSSLNLDILSNGFKPRTSTDGGSNASGGTYIYAAFSENAFSLNGGLAR